MKNREKKQQRAMVKIQNNWNELKEFIEKRIENADKHLNDPNENWDEDTVYYTLAGKSELQNILNKMQELKEKK